MLEKIRIWRNNLSLPAKAKAAMARDTAGLRDDPGNEKAISAVLQWLCAAQDNSASQDGGVARDYSLIDGWATSYPETTGYIIPTFLRLAHIQSNEELRLRAERMLDWCEEIQLEDGGFQGGKVDATPVQSVTFNTGQILIGLAAGVRELGRYNAAMHRAACFLRDSLDTDGCWRSHPTPFAKPGEKAYETHVSWGLFEAERVAPGEGFGAAGLRQVDWALGKQTANGWVNDCCLTDRTCPLTHTLGYYLRGVIEAHRLSNDEKYLNAATKTANGLLSTQRTDGGLPGRLKADWTPAVPWSCLTGNAQIAESWLYLYWHTKDAKFRDAAFAANAFVRRTLILEGEDGVRGGVAGSFPIDGDYGRFEYLNWAAKFLIDSLLAEEAVLRQEKGGSCTPP